MSTKYIWKCQKGKVIVKVVQVSDDWRYKDTIYRVYVMRKWWRHRTYDRLENAVIEATYLSLSDNYNEMINKKS